VATHQDDFFTRGPSPLARVTFFALLSVGVMIADHRFQALDQVRSGISTVLMPVERALAWPGDAVRKTNAYLRDQSELIAENKALNEKVLTITAEGQRAKLIMAEQAHVQALANAHARTGREGVIAERIRDARNPFSRKVIINRGAAHGVTRGSAVIDGAGIVGQVTIVGAASAEVTLSTEKDQSVPVMVVRNGYRAVVVGAGREGVIDMPFIPVAADVQVGDKLVTSGIDGTYPAGLEVGEVVTVDKNPAFSFAKIIARPVAAPDHHRFVKVIAPPLKPGATSAPAAPAGTTPSAPTEPAATETPKGDPAKTVAAVDTASYPAVDIDASAANADKSLSKRDARVEAKRHLRER
jgi:rod shape-determining protein MreC